MGVRERTGMRAAGHEAGEVRHIDQELGAGFVGDLAKRRKSNTRISRAAGDDDLRPVLCASFWTSSISMRWSSRRTLYGTGLNQRPDMFTGDPWVRCPPAARLRPMKVSPGAISAMNAAMLAEAPGVRLRLRTYIEKLCNPFNCQIFRHIDVLAPP